MKRKCGGRRFTLIFEELRFLAISQSLVSFFLRRKKKTMDNCCHNYVPYVCYVRITVSVSHIAQNILQLSSFFARNKKKNDKRKEVFEEEKLDQP